MARSLEKNRCGCTGLPCLYSILNRSILRGDNNSQDKFSGRFMFRVQKTIAHCIFILNICAGWQTNGDTVMSIGLQRHDRHTICHRAEAAIEVRECVPQFQ